VTRITQQTIFLINSELSTAICSLVVQLVAGTDRQTMTLHTL